VDQHRDHDRQITAADLAAVTSRQHWQRLSVGDGAKGLHLCDWVPKPLVDPIDPGWERWLLVCSSVSTPAELAYYVVYGPVGIGLAEMVRVAASRWTIEESFETAKGEVGLGQYEVCRWIGWYRHITLVLLAHAYLTVTHAVAAATQQRGGCCPSRLVGTHPLCHSRN
jgi:hypothetical protein